MEVVNLFPSDVYFEENTEIDNKKLSKIILEKEKTEPSREMTNQGGWQGNDDLHKDKRFSEVTDSVIKYFKLIHQNNSYEDTVKIVLDNMWANVNRHRDYNGSHTHGGVDWSFVYYVKSPKNSGNLVFCDPRIRKEMLPDNTFKNFDNLFTATIWWEPPSDGKFVMFPSYLEHYVKFNTTDKPRISISGNIKMERQ